MRSKEEANDYRYFPDPDLLPVQVSEEFKKDVLITMPELPDVREKRFIEELELPEYDAGVLTSSKELADYFEAVVDASNADVKQCANWVMGDFLAALNRDNLELQKSPIPPENLASLLNRIQDNTVSGKIAKEVFEAMWFERKSADNIIEEKGLKQITDVDAIAEIVKKVVEENPMQLEQYRSGKDKLFGFFVGQVMKATQGKANPSQVNDLLKELLK